MCHQMCTGCWFRGGYITHHCGGLFICCESFAEPLVDHAPCGSSAKSALPLGSCSCRSSGESMCAQESSTCESIGPWERDSQYFSGQDAFCARSHPFRVPVPTQRERVLAAALQVLA